MKKALLASAAATLLALPLLAQAQKKPEPEFTVTGNAGLFSDYRFRGFTQTGYKPAFQGGFDVAHKSGFYVGNWNSNVEQGLYSGASLEMDFYGGYKGTVGDVGYDVGYLYYYYPNSKSDELAGVNKVKNGELYIGASYGPVSAKWFYATTDFFSLGQSPAADPSFDTSGSWYLDLTGTFEVAKGTSIVAHYGYQKIKNGKEAYAQGLVGADTDKVADYKLGLTYDLDGWLLGAAYVGTSEKSYFTTAVSGFSEGAGKSKLVLSVSKTF